MNTIEWLDQIALSLLDTDAELRAALRTISRAGATTRHASTPAAENSRTITISAYEARAILHGLVPAPIAVRPLKRQHLRMGIAVNNLVGHLVALNNPLHDRRDTLQAATIAKVELTEWQRQEQWALATKQAHINGWKCPPLSITAVMQLTTLEQDQNLPSAAAAQDRWQESVAGFFDRIRAPKEPIQLDLELQQPTAQIIDLRQHVLELAA
jgi:hypothetical protein